MNNQRKRENNNESERERERVELDLISRLSSPVRAEPELPRGSETI